MLWRAFQGVADGYYVDVGAAHADTDSVTRAFYDRGWHGLNIEAVPAQAAAIARARPRDVTLAVAAGAGEGTIELRIVDGGGLSTTDDETALRLAELGIAARTQTVPLRPLHALLAEHAPPDIHFLKIDVEGAEQAVLAGADFARHRPRIVLIEATRPMSTEPSYHTWEPALLDAGFRFAFFDGLNRFYVADEWWAALAGHFMTPVNVLDNYIRVSEAPWARRAAEQQVQTAAALDRARIAEAAADLAYGRALSATLAQTAAPPRAAELAQAHFGDVAQHAALVDQAGADEAAALRTLLIATHCSTSWRLTRPLRMLGAQLRSGGPAVAAAAALPDDAAALRALLDATHRSTSWRVTGPLRAVATLLKTGGGSPPVMVAPPSPPIDASPVRAVPAMLMRAVHQFHSGSAPGDAVTNCMLLIRGQLRRLGYSSEIFVQHCDPALAGDLHPIDALPVHADHVLIVHHSMGYDALERVLASPAPKVLYYHNVTPVDLLPDVPSLRHYGALGRAQLTRLRDAVTCALTPSVTNTLELRRLGFGRVTTAPLLFDLVALQARRPDPAAADPVCADEARPYTVLFVGRVIESKAQADLVDAFAVFNARLGRPSRLVLAGRTDSPGTYLATVAGRVTAHGLGAAVVITGLLSDEALDAQYAAADLYVSLSLHEGFGVPLVEAMARAIPVLAWPAGAVAAVVGEGGLLADRDPAVVAGHMLAVANGGRDARVADQARHLGQFAWAHHWPAMQAALVAAGATALPDMAERAAIASHLHTTIAGHAAGSYSLAAINRNNAAAIEAVRPGRVRLYPIETVPTTDLSALPAAARHLAARPAPVAGPNVVVAQHFPIIRPDLPCDLMLAMTVWEESLVPADMVTALNAFDGIVVPTQFVARVLVNSGVSRPVRVVGQVPDLTPFVHVARVRPAIRPPGPFTFLHVSSAFPRKGVDVLLAAYAQAFRATDDVRLVIKTFPNPHNDVAAQIAALYASDPAAPAIDLIDADLEPDALLALYASADTMVLPTRGEGFNLPAAEAMAAGLPLIVTGMGGHMDFCDAATARLLAYRLAPSGSHLRTDGSLWAEPDGDDLVATLREAVAGPDPLRTGRARVQVQQRLDPHAFVCRVEAVSVELLQAPPRAPPRIAWVSSWAVRCGVAEYTRQLIDAMPPGADHVVLADDRMGVSPGVRSRPAWQIGSTDTVRLVNAIGAEDPDVVVLQYQAGLIPWAGLAGLLPALGIPGRIVVVTLHHTRDLPTIDPAIRTRVLEGLCRVDRVIVHTLEDVLRLAEYGLRDAVVLMPHGVPLPVAPASSANSGVIGCTGFFLPGKGIGALIEALAILRRDRPGLRLRLVNADYGIPASAEEIARCRAQVAALGLTEAVEFETRFLPHATTLALLAGCDAIIIPTQTSNEASSAAVRTALAAGPPVVVTPLPIFADVGEAVLRCAGISPAALAGAIGSLLDDPLQQAALQARRMAWVEAHAWPVVAARMQGMLLGLVNAGGSPCS